MRKGSMKIVAFALLISCIGVQADDSFIEINKLKYGSEKIAVGSINTNVFENIKLKPDTAQFSITYITQGDTPSDATNRNAANMKIFKEYLISLGIKDDFITTVGYRNYQNTVARKITDSKQLFQTSLSVNFVIPKDNFYNIINILEKSGVKNIIQDEHKKYYTFTIIKTSDNEDKAKKETQDAYEKIEKSLKDLGAHEIELARYETKNISKNSENIQRYFVSNTIQIKTENFDNLGKIITKASELKMSVNNDMSYSVSNKQRDEILAKNEALMLEKLTTKAKRLLTSDSFTLGSPKSLHYNSDGGYYPVAEQRMSYLKSSSVQNYGQPVAASAESVSIEAPSEYEISLSMSGSFDIIQSVVK